MTAEDANRLRAAIHTAAWANEYHDGRDAAEEQHRGDEAALERLLDEIARLRKALEAYEGLYS